MALFKTFKGLSSDLMAGKPNAIEGYAYFTTDEGKFYIDIAGDPQSNTPAVIGENRIPLNAEYVDKIPYAVNGENYITYNKTITTTDPFTLKNGSLILIKFISTVPGGDTEENNIITFNVNNTGQKKVYYRSQRIPNELFVQGKIYMFRVNTYHNSDNNTDELIYDLVGDVIPDLPGNETVITNSTGILTTRKFVDSYEIVEELPSSNIDRNKIYLVSTNSSSGGGSSSTSGLTYGLSKTGNTITLTASNGTTSSVTDTGLSQADTQALIDATITTALSTSYPQL